MTSSTWPPDQTTALLRAISADRIAAYRAAAQDDDQSAAELYVWDRNVSMALLADIAILEVALRNAMHTALSNDTTPRWFEHLSLDHRSTRHFSRATESVRRSGFTDKHHPSYPGRVIARCSLGTWLNLLDRGGQLTGSEKRADYEALWRRCLHKAFPGAPAEAKRGAQRASRSWVYSKVLRVNILRNRIAHHEPLVNGFPLPGQGIRLTARQGHDECLSLARILDRDLADWLSADTTVPATIAARPLSPTTRAGSDKE